VGLARPEEGGELEDDGIAIPIGLVVALELEPEEGVNEVTVELFWIPEFCGISSFKVDPRLRESPTPLIVPL